MIDFACWRRVLSTTLFRVHFFRNEILILPNVIKCHYICVCSFILNSLLDCRTPTYLVTFEDKHIRHKNCKLP